MSEKKILPEWMGHDLHPAQSYCNLGQALAKQGRWQEAIVAYRQALVLNPALEEARLGWDATQQQHPDFESASGNPSSNGKNDKATPTQTTQTGDAVKTYLKQAQYLVDRQDWQSAIDQCYRALQLQPDAAEAYGVLGDIFYSQRELQAAQDAYLKAIALQPTLAHIQANLGSLYGELQQPEEAIACYQKAIALKPNQPLIYSNWGRLYQEIDRVAEAIQCYRQAIELDPKLLKAYQGLAEALGKQRQWEDVATTYRQAIALQPTQVGLYQDLSHALIQQSLWEEAEATYRRAIEIAPDVFRSHYGLGYVLMHQHRWEESGLAYQRAIALNSKVFRSHYYLGQSLMYQERWEEAIAAYQKSIELQPDWAYAYSSLGDIFFRQEHWHQAIAYYQKAIELDSNLHVSVYRNLGEALERTQTGDGRHTPQTLSPKWPHLPIQPYSPPKTLPDGRPWPKISIVTPSFNQGQFIEETILSVIHQNYPNVEHILMDGGSTDETMEIVQRYQDHFSYIVSEPDRGQSNALNKGFKQATGEIFTWINSDDRLAPGALYAVALAFYTSGADLIAGVCQIWQNDREVHQHLTSCGNGFLPLDDILDLDNCWLKGKFFYQPEVMFTRAIWEKAGGFVDESLFYSMDYELWARLAASGAKIHVIGAPVAQYRMHDQQKTSTIDKYEPELRQVREALLERWHRPQPQPERQGRRDRLRIVCFNDVGFQGGAGIAHQRIAQAWALAGHQVISVAGTLDWALTPADCTAPEVYQRIAALNPDVVMAGNLHNTQYPVEILEMLVTHFPTLFVMHDQWLLTGRCGYVGSCEKYTSQCDAQCPTSGEYPSLDPAKIADAFERKHRLVQHSDELLVLGDSRWTTNWGRYALLSHESSRLVGDRDRQFQPIYYGIDLNAFRPLDKVDCRKKVGLPLDKFIILTGSQSIDDERKGFKYLLKALAIANLDDVVVVSFGYGFYVDGNLDVRCTGYIDHPDLLACYYSAADVFVGPSQEEAFGQTFVEAAACGTPAVGYHVGGIKEAILNRVSGRVVAAKTPEALAQVITELYHDRDQLELLSATAPWYVANSFSLRSSYHSFMASLQHSGWLEKLQLRPGTQFSVEIPKLATPFSLKGGIGNHPKNVVVGTGIEGYTLSGFGSLEPPQAHIGLFRPSQWLLSGGGRIVLLADEPKRGQLVMSFRNMLAEQFVEVWDEYQLLLRVCVPHTDIHLENVVVLPVVLRQGSNFLALKSDRFYANESDPRELAILIDRIQFVEQWNWQDGDRLTGEKGDTERSIVMDNSLLGMGWLPTEYIEGQPVRWMEKVGQIVVEGMDTSQSIELKIDGITAVDGQFLTDLVVRVNDRAIEGQVLRRPDGSWDFEGVIPAEILQSGCPFVLMLASPGVKQLALTDSRWGSLLVSGIRLRSVE
jgi:tetratricopeptide (TPR) repeat protein/glycosyltransferase involved in cell wall biosynthesis